MHEPKWVPLEDCYCHACRMWTVTRERDEARAERDEARRVARDLMNCVNYSDYMREHAGDTPSHLWAEFPWLKEGA